MVGLIHRSDRCTETKNDNILILIEEVSTKKTFA